MASPRAFISFDFDNNKKEKDLFIGQSRNSRTPFNIEDWSSKTHLPQREWEELVNNKVNKCNLLIVLIGSKTHSATGVIKEIAFATANNVPMFGIYVEDVDATTPLPTGLPRSRVIIWNWENVSNLINQMMKEGKNKGL